MKQIIYWPDSRSSRGYNIRFEEFSQEDTNEHPFLACFQAHELRGIDRNPEYLETLNLESPGNDVHN
jgi:hypothetical protein